MTAVPDQALRYPLGDTLPAPGQALELAPGVRWVRMALPFALDHVNVWLLRERLDGVDGWSVVDTGIANDATRAAWERVFAEALDGLPLLRVIVTHMHPDHIGLAHWLTERWNCRLWISATDYHAACHGSRSTTGHGGAAAAAFFRSHGLADAQALAKVRERGNYYASMVPQVPSQYRRLLDGMRLPVSGHEWECIVGYGHAPEHISLHCPTLRVLISGDMLLPRISTNVSVLDLEPEANPLPLYLASLERLAQLPPDTLVLPSHGKPFVGIPQRVAQLRQHHDARLQEVLQACAREPLHAAALLPVLFRRPLDMHQTTFAMGEAIAHLHALWLSGQLRRHADADGVWRFGKA
ncbi:MBL fold metallo-hydrolase [Azohydromonas caseinilytica]|uniref:MBL fold metallo-hydrolase n=1 Tax=Azohydromonas caseinilytica TaxID=2728836 RepID=A0A848F941_9BURK|nr:MBL fold metallo-hydrolase [Azohydromonas caseinilytica]NML15326.1 MBL fold metallo-hydrolase [Azohydromonas caseinilytica]